MTTCNITDRIVKQQGKSRLAYTVARQLDNYSDVDPGGYDEWKDNQLED